MKTVGEILRRAREEKGISLGEVALSTKISPRILKAMEENDPEKLPPKTFLRGFVQSYASLLELDVKDLMDTFQSEMGNTRPQPPVLEPLPGHDPRGANKDPKSRKIPFTYKGKSKSVASALFITCIIAALFVSIFALRKKMASYEREQVVGGVPKLKALPHSTGPFQGQFSKAEKNERNPTKATKPTLRTSSTAKTKSKIKATTPEEQSPTPSSANPSRVSQKRSQNLHSSTGSETLPLQKKEKTPQQVKSRKILIEALGPVLVTVEVPGKKSNKFRLLPDETKLIQSRSKVTLSISDGGAVSITLNGQDLGIPGNINEPIRLKY